MGSAVSCEECARAETATVINLSDALVLRMVNGINEPPSKTYVPPEDSDWIEKIKCIDEAHTMAYGLTVRELEILIANVEQRLREGTLRTGCPTDVVKGCYKFNSKCTLNCSKEVEEFINCLDAKRLLKLKTLVDQAHKEEEEHGHHT